MRANFINGTTFKLFKVNADGSTTRVIDVVVMLSSDGLKATLNPPSLHLLGPAGGQHEYRATVTTRARDHWYAENLGSPRTSRCPVSKAAVSSRAL
jgi:hypothetical protein